METMWPYSFRIGKVIWKKTNEPEKQLPDNQAGLRLWGIEKENPKSMRHRLVNPYYFSGTYNGEEGNSRLWEAVYAYIEQNYDLDHVKKIFLNGDGGSWIKAGKKKIENRRDYIRT